MNRILLIASGTIFALAMTAAALLQVLTDNADADLDVLRYHDWTFGMVQVAFIAFVVFVFVLVVSIVVRPARNRLRVDD